MQPKTYRIILVTALCLTSLATIAQKDPVDSPDSLYKIRSGTAGSERAQIDLELARYYFQKDMDSLMHYVYLLEADISENYDVRTDAFIRKFKGFRAYQDLDAAEAMEYASQAMALFQQVKDFREMGWLSMNLGTNYYRLGDFATATEYYLQGLAYFEKVDHMRGIAEAYNNLGRISYEAGDEGKSREYFETALEIFTEIGDEVHHLKIYNNLGLLLMEDGKIRASLDNLQKAAMGFSRTGDLRRLAVVYGNIAIDYDELQQADSAMLYSRKALALSRQQGDEMGMISGLINLGYFLRLEKKYDSSLVCFEQALELSVKNKLPVYEESVYYEFSDLFADMEDYRTAYAYHILQDSINDVIRDDQAQRRVEELMLSYNQQIRDNELLQLREDQKMQKRLNLIFLLTIVLSFVVVIILVSGYRRNRQQKQLLEEKNDLLEEINTRLEISEEELKEVNNEQRKLFSIVAHDLRNPISAVSGFAELIREKYAELDDETRQEYIEQISQGAFRTLSLLENLLLWARSQMDLVKVKKESVPVNALINPCVNHLMSSVEKKNLSLKIQLDEEFDMFVDREMIKAVLRNLISNAIKFSYPGREILIRSYTSNAHQFISVKDEGTGISAELKKVLFSTGSNHTTEGTANERGSGLGLLISKDYTEKNGGMITVESEHGKGSIFTISFPASV